MYRLSALYGQPTDRQAFDHYYWNTHLHIAKRRTGIRRWSVTMLEPGPTGEPPPFYCVADMYLDSRADLEAMIRSDAGRASREDVANFATGGVTFLYGDDRAILADEQEGDRRG